MELSSSWVSKTGRKPARDGQDASRKRVEDDICPVLLRQRLEGLVQAVSDKLARLSMQCTCKPKIQKC